MTESMLEQARSVGKVKDGLNEEYAIVMDGIKYADVGVPELKKEECRDNGSILTHGTDVVFAGNVTSALRRRRSEKSSIVEEMKKEEIVPASPNRESITETLDRAHLMETCTREDILMELKEWKRENAGTELGRHERTFSAQHSPLPPPAPSDRIVPPMIPMFQKAVSKNQPVERKVPTARQRMKLELLTPCFRNIDSDEEIEAMMNENSDNRSPLGNKKATRFDLRQSLKALDTWRNNVESDDDHSSNEDDTEFNSTGEANKLTDKDLLLMLSSSKLRNKETFRAFFQGMETTRLSSILHTAYDGNTDKVNARLALMST